MGLVSFAGTVKARRNVGGGPLSGVVGAVELAMVRASLGGLQEFTYVGYSIRCWVNLVAST